MEDCNDSWPDAQGEIRLGDAHKTQLFVLEEVICKSVLPQHMWKMRCARREASCMFVCSVLADVKWHKVAWFAICSSGDIFELKEDVTEVSYCDLKRAKSNSIFSRLIFANRRWFCFHGARFYDVGWRAGKKNVLAKRTKVDFGPYVNMENMISRHETDTVKNGSERTKIFFWPKLQGNLTPIYESRFSYQKCLYTLHKLSRSKFASD